MIDVSNTPKPDGTTPKPNADSAPDAIFAVAGRRFNWRRVLLKEYGSTRAWTAGALALMAADTLAYHSYDERAGYLTLLWMGIGLLTLGWATTRYLKKSRRLREASAA